MEYKPKLARLNKDGSVDLSFNTAPIAFKGGNIYSIAKQSDGTIITGGNFNQVLNNVPLYFNNLVPLDSLVNISQSNTFSKFSFILFQ